MTIADDIARRRTRVAMSAVDDVSIDVEEVSTDPGSKEDMAGRNKEWRSVTRQLQWSGIRGQGAYRERCILLAKKGSVVRQTCRHKGSEKGIVNETMDSTIARGGKNGVVPSWGVAGSWYIRYTSAPDTGSEIE